VLPVVTVAVVPDGSLMSVTVATAGWLVLAIAQV